MEIVEWSVAELARAFEAVAARKGCGGVDRVTLGGFARNLISNLQALVWEMNNGRYRPLPLLRIVVSKKNGEGRNLSIPAVRDRVAQRAVLERIGPRLEALFENCSFAYRPGRSVLQALAQVTNYCRQGYRWVVDADIDAYFDRVDHDLLLGKLAGVVEENGLFELLESWIRVEVWDGSRLVRIDRGIPQGSAVSPVLANFFLDEFDEAMLAADLRYVRYADDFVVLCKTRDQAEAALELSEELLETLALELDDREIVHTEKGFRFLGATVLNDMAWRPLDTVPAEKKVLHWPAPFNLEAYLLRRKWLGK